MASARRRSRTTSPPIVRVGGKVVVLQEGNDNLVGDWIDQIMLRRTRQGVFTVLARKYMEDCHRPGRRKWVELEKLSAIKAPEALIKAMDDPAECLGVTVDWDRSVREISTLDWFCAAIIAEAQGISVPALPPVDELLPQRSLRSLGKVSIGVEWGYDMHYADLSFEQWVRILVGEDYYLEMPYHYEGERFTGEWRFGNNHLDVGYDDGGEGWSGTVSSIESWTDQCSSARTSGKWHLTPRVSWPAD